MAYLDNFNPEKIDSIPEARQQFRFLKKAIDNGEIGSGGGGAVDSVNGKTGVVVLDAEDVGAYEKPSSGIPATDLDSNVQEALDKADSSYVFPEGGIPKEDMSTEVKSTLDAVATNTEGISINTAAIAALQELYEGLTESDIVPVASLPASGVVNTIYRVAGTTTYSDYMWNGSSFVKLAEYNNNIGTLDSTPTSSSNNAVKSGGLYTILQGTYRDNFDTNVTTTRKNVAYRKSGFHTYINNLGYEGYFFVTGTATADGTITININSTDYTASITSGDTADVVATKIITAIGNNATCTNLYTIVKINKSSSTAITMTSNTTGITIGKNEFTSGYQSVVDEKVATNFDNTTDARFGDAAFWRRVISYPYVSRMQFNLTAINRITIDSAGRIIWYTQDNYLKTDIDIYLVANKWTYIVPKGYELVAIGYYQNNTLQPNVIKARLCIRAISNKNTGNSDYVLIRNYNDTYLSYCGHLIDEWNELKAKLTAEYVLIRKGRIPYTIAANGDVTITNPSTQTYDSRYTIVAKGYAIEGIAWQTQTIPNGYMLVLNIATKTMDVRKFARDNSQLWGAPVIGQHDVVLLINNDGAFDGLWAEYLRAYSQNGVYKKEILPSLKTYSPTRGSHDLTVVGDEIWSFSKPTDDTKVYRLNKDTYTNLGYFSQNFYESDGRELQMKSVDWNSNSNQLLVGNGSAQSAAGKSWLYVFYECENWPTSSSALTFENCGAYTKIDVSDLGVKSYAYWAKTQDDMIYVSTAFFKNIYLVKLGKGTNNLGHGTYTAANADTFNGSWVVCKEWHQSINNSYSDHGGQVWNGSLYIVPNNTGTCNVYKFNLQNTGDIDFDIIRLSIYNNSGALTYKYIDGMCITDDGRLIACPLTPATAIIEAKLLE